MLKIENRKDHFSKEFEDVAMEFRKSKRGRKRRNYLQAKNMYEFLQSQVLIDWKLALDQYSSRERELQVYQHDMKFVWVQFFKDVRRFYRIMFRLRFHRWDKRKDFNRDSLVRTILEDLGMPIVSYDKDKLFGYFYPVLTKLRKWNSQQETDGEIKMFSFQSKEDWDVFMRNNLWANLIYFFIVNYSETYLDHMTGIFKKKVAKILKVLVPNKD